MRKHVLFREPDVVAEESTYTPVRVLELEIGQPLPSLCPLDEKTGQYYRYARCLIRLHTQPLGIVEIELPGEVEPHSYVSRIWSALSEQINEHLRQDGLPEVTGLGESGICCPDTPLCMCERETFAADPPFVSVIIATRDRPETLRSCLLALVDQHYTKYEIIVVDNAPSTNDTARVVHQFYQDGPQIRYVREDHPGLSWARNRGIEMARGEILAFTDDDMIVDAYWLLELVRGFYRADHIACVTGLILPMQLETVSQFWFEEYGGYGKGFKQRIFDLQENHPGTPLYPYKAGDFGSGGCMAFTAAFLRSVNGFDSALGAGSPAKGAEEIVAFFQVITKGYKLFYEPAAIAYHLHHRDYTNLQRQIYNYGIGLTVFLTRSICNNPFLLFDLLAKIPYGFFFILSRHSPKNSKKSIHYPKKLTRLELQGMLRGPFAYVRSRLALRRTYKRIPLRRAGDTWSRAREV